MGGYSGQPLVGAAAELVLAVRVAQILQRRMWCAGSGEIGSDRYCW